MNQQKGYIALISILIITTTALVVAISVSFLSREEGRLIATENAYFKSNHIADACLNEALAQIAGVMNQGTEILWPEDNDVGEANLISECINNYECVNKETSGTANYGDNKLDLRDIYIFTDPVLLIGKIKQVNIIHRGGVVGGGSNREDTILRLDGTDRSVQSGFQTQYGYEINVEHPNNPFNDEDWTRQNVKDLRAGINLYDAGTYDVIWVYSYKLEITYTAEQTLVNVPIAGGLCDIDIVETSDNMYEVSVSATTSSLPDEVTKKLKATVDTSNGYPELIDWQESE